MPKPTPKREKSFRVPGTKPPLNVVVPTDSASMASGPSLTSLDGRSLDEVSLCSELTTPTYASMADKAAAAELAEKEREAAADAARKRKQAAKKAADEKAADEKAAREAAAIASAAEAKAKAEAEAEAKAKAMAEEEAAAARAEAERKAAEDAKAAAEKEHEKLLEGIDLGASAADLEPTPEEAAEAEQDELAAAQATAELADATARPSDDRNLSLE